MSITWSLHDITWFNPHTFILGIHVSITIWALKKQSIFLFESYIFFMSLVEMEIWIFKNLLQPFMNFRNTAQFHYSLCLPKIPEFICNKPPRNTWCITVIFIKTWASNTEYFPIWIILIYLLNEIWLFYKQIWMSTKHASNGKYFTNMSKCGHSMLQYLLARNMCKELKKLESYSWISLSDTSWLQRVQLVWIKESIIRYY